jgi:hypothetical protein
MEYTKAPQQMGVLVTQKIPSPALRLCDRDIPQMQTSLSFIPQTSISK